MPLYRVVIEENALKSLKQISNPHKTNIFSKLKSLDSFNNSTPSIKKLRNYPNGYRMRVGDYRILFILDVRDKVIKVYRIGHRKDVYR